MVKNSFSVVIGVGCLMLCVAFAGGYYFANSRSAGEISLLSERYNQLSREYTERQRELESNLTKCIGYVENARAIVERTGGGTGRVISNLREASAYIKQGIEERKNLEMEHSRLYSALYRTRDMGRAEIEQVEEAE